MLLRAYLRRKRDGRTNLFELSFEGMVAMPLRRFHISHGMTSLWRVQCRLIEGRWESITIDEQEAFNCVKKMLIDECIDISAKMKHNAAGIMLSMKTFDNYIKGICKASSSCAIFSGPSLPRTLCRFF